MPACSRLMQWAHTVGVCSGLVLRLLPAAPQVSARLLAFRPHNPHWGKHTTPDLPFFRTTSSDSGLRLTETTFITRWFPPCRIKETTCLCPTFTTLTPFT